MTLVAACSWATADLPAIGETTQISVGDTSLSVWVADTRVERNQGLRGIEALPAGVDGMLFVYETPARASFGMRDTLIPLDIWWFDSHGVLNGGEEMLPCPDGGCVSYDSPGAVSWVLETPMGEYEFAPGDRLRTSGSG